MSVAKTQICERVCLCGITRVDVVITGNTPNRAVYHEVIKHTWAHTGTTQGSNTHWHLPEHVQADAPFQCVLILTVLLTNTFLRLNYKCDGVMSLQSDSIQFHV